MTTPNVRNPSHRSMSSKVFAAAGLIGALVVAACTPTSASPTAQSVQPTAAAPTAAPLAQPTAAPTVAPQATATVPVLSEDAVMDAVRKAWETMAVAGPRKVVQTSKNADGTGMTIEAVFVPPDSLHQIVTIGGQQIAEQYSVGNTIYNNTLRTGGWVSSPAPGGTVGVLKLFGDSSAADGSLTYSNARVEGAETVNGAATVIYAYATQLKGADMVVQHRLWVDTATGLPARNEIVDDEGQTVQEFTFDNSLSVDLPADVASAPPAP